MAGLRGLFEQMKSWLLDIYKSVRNLDNLHVLAVDQLNTYDVLCADDVVFTSPVAFAPYPGKPITHAILEAVMQVFEDFHYVREIGHDGDRDSALVFSATVDGKQDDLHIALVVTTALPSAVLRQRLGLLAGNGWQLRDVTAA